MALEKIYNRLKLKYPEPNLIILFEGDDFVQCINDDAITVSKILGTILTKKEYEMTGFNKSSLDLNLQKLVRSGHKVAVVSNLVKL